MKFSVSDIVNNIIKDSPDLVGIYTNTSNYYAVSKLTSEIKKAKKSQKVVLGGPHPTFLPKDTIEETVADYCVIGEGEETLLELVQYIDTPLQHSNSEGLEKINGLVFRRSDSLIVINRPRKRIDDLDNLPFPAVHLLPQLSKYKLYLLHYKRLPYMTLITSRGCPHKCTFCETPFGKLVRFHSPDYVVDYIAYLANQFGVKELHFCDDTFTLDEKRVVAICDLIKKRNLDVTWYANVRANIKDRNIFKAMKGAGCWICAVGVESGDPEILHLIGKQITIEEIMATCDSVLKAGLILKSFFILGNPGETLETIEHSIRFAISLKAHYPVFSLMTPYPGAKLWETAEKYGTFDRTNFQKLKISTSDPVFIPFGMTKEILLKKQKEAFRRAYCNLGMVARQLAVIRSLDDIRKIAKAAYIFFKVEII